MWRSLVARVVRDDEVAGSNPVIPTREKEGPPRGGSSFVSPAPLNFWARDFRWTLGPGRDTAPGEISRGCAGLSCRGCPAEVAKDPWHRSCYIGSGQFPTLSEAVMGS